MTWRGNPDGGNQSLRLLLLVGKSPRVLSPAPNAFGSSPGAAIPPAIPSLIPPRENERRFSEVSHRIPQDSVSS